VLEVFMLNNTCCISMWIVRFIGFQVFTKVSCWIADLGRTHSIFQYM
jgi:hypothetical protein